MPKILRFRTGRQIAYAACSAVVNRGATPVHVLGDRAARAICSPEEARLLSRQLAAEVEVVVHSERAHQRLPGSSLLETVLHGSGAARVARAAWLRRRGAGGVRGRAEVTSLIKRAAPLPGRLNETTGEYVEVPPLDPAMLSATKVVAR